MPEIPPGWSAATDTRPEVWQEITIAPSQKKTQVGEDVSHISNIPAIQEAFHTAAGKLAFKILSLIGNHIKREMGRPHTGIRYRVPGTSREYTASAPGEYPAIRLGYLRSSLQTKIEMRGERITGVLGSNLEYGRELEGEFGNGIRPWLNRAMLEVYPQIEKAIQDRGQWEILSAESGTRDAWINENTGEGY